MEASPMPLTKQKKFFEMTSSRFRRQSTATAPSFEEIGKGLKAERQLRDVISTITRLQFRPTREVLYLLAAHDLSLNDSSAMHNFEAALLIARGG